MPHAATMRRFFVPTLAAGAIACVVAGCSSGGAEGGSPNAGTIDGGGGSSKTGTGGQSGGKGNGGSEARGGGSGTGGVRGTGGRSGTGGHINVGGGSGAGVGGGSSTDGRINAGGGSGTGGAAGSAGADGAAGGGSGTLEKFSFFVTSLKAIQQLSKSQKGFGGDLRYGKADGLSGADEICRQVAEMSMPGSGAKGWRAFLSVTKGPDGNPVHAIDRIGEGPWYDRLGRIVAANKAALTQIRPQGAHSAIVNDLPNEDGTPNHDPDGTGDVDNHDTLTGSGTTGQLYKDDWSVTCHDWTSSVPLDGRPRVGHTWPRGNMSRDPMAHWISALDEAGCAPGVNLIETGPPDPANPTVGSGGGYGGFYCLALTP